MQSTVVAWCELFDLHFSWCSWPQNQIFCYTNRTLQQTLKFSFACPTVALWSQLGQLEHQLHHHHCHRYHSSCFYYHAKKPITIQYIFFYFFLKSFILHADLVIPKKLLDFKKKNKVTQWKWKSMKVKRRNILIIILFSNSI